MVKSATDYTAAAASGLKDLIWVHLLYGVRVHPLKQGPFGLGAVGARKGLGFHRLRFKLDTSRLVRPAEGFTNQFRLSS